MKCFHILWFLSSSRIGQLEIVRDITRSGYVYLEAFYSALV
jgi:hypothetical protein